MEVLCTIIEEQQYGGIIAILILCTGLLKLVVGILILCAGVFLGNYVQQNKYEVKQKLVDFINRI